jgi:hypothetical protein
MKMTRFLCGFASIAIALALLVPVSAQAGGYPTNSCVSAKQKAAGKFCQGALKAWSKYARDPSKDAGGTKRDASISKAGTKLSKSWGKAEDKADKKSVDCSITTVDAATAQGQLTAAVTALEAAVSNGVDPGDKDDRKCRSGILKAASKLCSSYLKAESKFIKAPVKDADRARKTSDKSKADGKFSTAYAKSVTTCIAGQADEATVLADVDTATQDLRLSTIVAPNAPTSFTHVVDGVDVLPGPGDEVWGPGPIAYEKRTLTPRCVKDTPYSFFYKKGTVNKLLMFYMGGGACWDNTSCWVANANKQTAEPGDNPDLMGTGFAAPNDPRNIFADWHFVFVNYCSGDIHWGDTETVYSGGVIKHFGYQHALLAEKWARERFVDPEEVFVTGLSAGSYGAILNSVSLMESVYPASPHNVLGDAGTGVITREWLDARIQNWGVDANLPDVLGIDTATELSSPEMWIRIANAFPQHRFAQYQSAYDGSGGGQSAFYNVMKNPFDAGEWLFWWQNTCEWNACMLNYIADIETATSAVHDNFRSYTGAGSRHHIIDSDKVYTETTEGITAVDWINEMRTGGAGWVSVNCANDAGCDLVSTCQGGTNAGLSCTDDLDCPGVRDNPAADPAFCQHDPDPGAGNSPYNGDGTVVCAPTVCPCATEVVCAP